jgi:hypothetical protein
MALNQASINLQPLGLFSKVLLCFQVHQLLGEVLGPGLHAKRIASLADATLGVMHTASLAVCTIGHGLAVARSLNARHAVKQVDRMLSNPGIDVDQILALWAPFMIGARSSLLMALDWTDFDADNQATIMLSFVLLTLLGAASEAAGYDRMLKTNHSLFRQGCMVYDLIPTMPERWLQPLMLAFTRLLEQQPLSLISA